jgi:hypothetical protein
MNLFRRTILLAAVVFLAACGSDTQPTVTVTLEAPAEVQQNTSVNLKATVIGATAATVDFVIQDGAAVEEGVTASEDGTFSAVSDPISAPTTFVAIARDADGEIGRSEPKEVNIAAAPAPTKPVATPKTVTTLAGVAVVGGTPTPAPTTLAATTEKLAVPAGATAQVVAGSARGGEATVQSDGSFTFVPSGEAAASFQYEVVLAGVKSDPATVSITVKPLPANTVLIRGESATSLDDLRAATALASSTTTIMISGTIPCDDEADCVVLKPNQRLVGAGVVDGVTLEGIARIDVTSAQPEDTPPGNNDSTAITLAAGVTVEGIEVSGRDIFSAILGSSLNLVEPGTGDPSTVTIRSVTVSDQTSNRPLRIGGSVGSLYNLVVDKLTVRNAAVTFGFGTFETLTFTDSEIEFAATVQDIEGSTFVTASKGLSIISEGTATVLLDDVDVRSATARETFTPIFLAHGSAGGTVTVTVTNSDVTFPGATPTQLAEAASFGFDYENSEDPPRGGMIDIQTEGSTNNSSEGGGIVTYLAEAPNTPATKIRGHIQGTPADVFIVR